MSTIERYRSLRAGYYRRLELGVVLAMGVHALFFAAAPPYVPRPFRLRQELPLRLVQPGSPAAGPAGTPTARAALPGPPPLQPMAVRSEQIETVSTRASGAPPTPDAAPGLRSGMPGGGTAGGADEEAPPVFYAYDTPPRVVRRVEPEYPLAARIAGAQGTVVVNANVDTSGRILRAWVARATAPETLVEAALDAVYQFEFLPGKQGTIPVTCTVAIPFRFLLRRT
ncbi:MAG TPA: TonB family protein [Candidatus Eisenbacteria bacterium]